MSARLAKGRKRAAMGIYRRKRTWWIKYHDQNRRRIQESSHSSIRHDAERLHALRKSEVLRGVYREPVRISLDSFADRYMEYAKTNKRSWLRDEQLLKPLKEFFRIERQLAEITPPEIEGYKLWRRKQVSGATVNRELALLKHMFNLAIDWDLYLGSNPLRKVKFFQEVNTGFRVLKPDEETRLLRSATPAIQDVVPYALNTGSRIGEIFSLRWQNVDLDRGLINVFSPKTPKDPRRSDQFGSAPDSGFLGSGAEERVRLLQPENRRTVRRSRCRSRKRLRGGEDRRSDVAYAAPHFCFTSSRAGSGHHDGERTVGTLDASRCATRIRISLRR
jgi:integrase